MTDIINWGILGCGDVTEVKSGPSFSKVKNSRLVAVMRRNGEKAKDYAVRHNVPRWYDNAEKLINDPEVNAVYIATPPGSHAEYAIRAMRAGKVAYVEKPMATSYPECRKMIRVSKDTGAPLLVAYYRRMLPGFLKIKELIDSGIIGTPLLFSIRFYIPPYRQDLENLPHWRIIPEISGGGYVFDLGSHQLDLIDYILGPIDGVASMTLNQGNLYKPEDFVSAGFSCETGVAGNAVWSFTAPEHMREDSIEIAGEKGKITFSCFDFTPTELKSGNETKYYDNPRPQHVQQPLIQAVVDELLGRGKCPSTGITAARTSRILDKIVRKSATSNDQI